MMVTVMGSMWNVCHNYPICGCKNTCPLMSGSKPKMECVYNHNGITCACATDGLTECKYAPKAPTTISEGVRRTDLSKPPSPWLKEGAPKSGPPINVREFVEKLGANPKDRLGAKKIDLGIVPAVGIWHEAAAFFDGGIEYDPFNWRDNKVLARVYIAAMRRHIDEWESGIEETADTGVHHLGAVRACANILLDAQMTGNLIDNRPKAPAFAAVVDKLNAWAKARVAKGRYRNV